MARKSKYRLTRLEMMEELRSKYGVPTTITFNMKVVDIYNMWQMKMEELSMDVSEKECV